MKTIIVPLDFSKESLTGLNLAFMIAGKTGANILMVHVIAKESSADSEQFVKDSKFAKTKFEALLMVIMTGFFLLRINLI
jgi:hypothetical protein